MYLTGANQSLDTTMKRYIVLWVLAALFLSACGTPDTPLPRAFTNQNGLVKVEYCSRGCEQYVLMTSGRELATFFIMNMPDSLKMAVIRSKQVGSELPVVFSGTRSDELEQISVADINDAPKPAYKAYKLQLIAIRRR